MTIHPSVLDLSKRLIRFLPIAGVVAATTYAVSVCPHVYPGYSATLTAAAAGINPPSFVTHSLFTFVSRVVAACELFSLPIRLNLLSALCGTLCAMLIYRLVSRTILFYACEDAGGGGLTNLLDESVKARMGHIMPPEIDRYNRRVFPIAVAGGLAAVFIFTYSAAIWSAATRLNPGLFDLLLALMSLSLFPRGKTPSRLPRLALSVFLFVVGILDSAVFLVLFPCFAFLTFKVFWFSRQRLAMAGCIVAAGLAAVGFSLVIHWQNGGAPPDKPFLLAAQTFVRMWPHHQYRELRAFFPHSGWAWVVFPTGILASVLLFGKRILFKKRQADTFIALILVLFAAVPGLLNLPWSPFAVFQATDHLPVFSSALLAATAACAIAACLVLLIPSDESPSVPGPGRNRPHRPKPLQLLLRTGAQILLAVLTLLAIATPGRSYPVVARRRGAFADTAAREILSAMGDRTWLISNGYLDNHLLIQSRILGKPLILVALRARVNPHDTEKIRREIAFSPVFAGQNRQRLQNALSIGTVRFVMEWFSRDPHAARHAMVWASPDIWTACGYRAIPVGLVFGGLNPATKPDLCALEQASRTLAEKVAPLFDKKDGDSGYLAALREMLHIKAGLAVNELGVFLEDMGEPDAALQAYERATRIDPGNISAAINGYTLANTLNRHPETLDRLKARVKNLMSEQGYPVWGVTGIVQTYGTIRQKPFYQQQAAMWASLGSQQASVDKGRRALSLSKRTGVEALIENAAFYADAQYWKQAEACYTEALEQDISNHDALSGMSKLMVTTRRTEEAEKWLQKALDSGVNKDSLLYQTIQLATLKGDIDQALQLLKEATERHPKDLRYWTLLADLLLGRGDIQTVEYHILPSMQRALKSPNHYLIHAVRGFTLKKKGPYCFKEARLSLLKALSLHAALPRVWDAVLELDAAIGNLAFITTDAKNLLNVDPDHALANYILGSVALANGSLAESEDFLRRSIERSPTAAACNDLGENLRRQKRLAEAEGYVRQAISLDPALVSALDTLANLLCDAGRVDAAAEYAAQAVAASPRKPDFQLTLLRIQLEQGDYEGVRQRLETLSESKTVIPDDLKKKIANMK